MSNYLFKGSKRFAKFDSIFWLYRSKHTCTVSKILGIITIGCFFRYTAQSKMDKNGQHGCFTLSILSIVIQTDNGHRKQQIELYREPTNAVSFSNFIDPRLTYNKRCMAVLTGAPRTARGNTFTQLYKIYKLPYELGGTPFGQWAWSAPGPQSIRGHPELLQIILRNKIICNFTKDYATLKLLGLGKNTFRPLEQSHVQSVNR